MTTLPRTLLLLLLRAYKLGISPFLGNNCRFHPSCADYAAEAIRVHGAGRGCLLAGKRLCRCHPWHPGGLDPVPPVPAAPGLPQAGSSFRTDTACRARSHR